MHVDMCAVFLVYKCMHEGKRYVLILKQNNLGGDDLMLK